MYQIIDTIMDRKMGRYETFGLDGVWPKKK